MQKIKYIAGGDTLILNSDGAPISIIPNLSTLSWDDAIMKVMSGKVDVLATYDQVVRSENTEMNIPAVVISRKWCANPRTISFCPKFVFLRDEYQCQYCGNIFHPDLLTMDHYIPKLNGGPKTFDNIVSACAPCNSKKGHQLQQPLNKPYTPTYYDLVNKRRKNPIIVNHDSWNFYLGWNASLVKIQNWVCQTKY
jgi:5-methylcytosine-specific restriction endonuclease McrA